MIYPHDLWPHLWRRYHAVKPPKVVAPPTSEQITLAEARLHLRLDDDGDSPAAHPDDPWLSTFGLPGAREFCEGFLGRALAPQTLEYALDAFPVGDIVLPMAPVTAITWLHYTDSLGVQTLATTAYAFDNYSVPPLLRRGYGTSWPTTEVVPNAVVVRYEAGYSLAGDSPMIEPIPTSIKSAMLLVLGHLYKNREQTTELRFEDLPLGVYHLLRPYQVRLGMA